MLLGRSPPSVMSSDMVHLSELWLDMTMLATIMDLYVPRLSSFQVWAD